jgi:ELWxxDGT repeat protein
VRHLAVCPLLALLAAPAAGLEPYLVKDINAQSESRGSNPDGLVTFQGAAFLRADDGVSGAELWRSDGTEAGTWLVEDLCAPDCSGTPVPFAVTPGLYFFTAGTPGPLWVTGGTAAGTFQLTDGPTGAARLWVASRRLLLFAARDAARGEELWASDGTRAGTYPVADVRPGPADSGIQSLAELKGKAFFLTRDGLWRTDGTPRGTVKVQTLGMPRDLRAFGRYLYFSAFTPARGVELWRSDGTAKGTLMLADLTPGKTSTAVEPAALLGTRLLFLARADTGLSRLWVTDGTAAGTRALTPPAVEPFGVPAALGGRLVFAAHQPGPRNELWISDGTVAGTLPLRDGCPGTCPALLDGFFVAAGGRAYFQGATLEQGAELWATDGTAAGTRLVRDLCPGVCSSSPGPLKAVGSRLLFSANHDLDGHELWATDGTAGGTELIDEVGIREISAPFVGTMVGGNLLYPSEDEQHGLELWRTDGTAAGTSLVRDINRVDVGGASLVAAGTLGERAFFFAQDGEHGHELWASDGTAAGTALVQELVPGEEPRAAYGRQEPAEAAGGRLFFLHPAGDGMALWATDGTAAGTRRLSAPGLLPCCELRAVGSLVFFFARRADLAGGELWVSDGTEAGTRRVRDGFSGDAGRELDAFTAALGKLWFLAPAAGGAELWVSDGTAAGTLPFDSLLPRDLARASIPTAHAGRLWFVADDGEHGAELWSTDGTPAGTRLELDVVPGPDELPIERMAFFEGRLFFAVAAHPLVEEDGLWVSDLTAAGTRRLSPVPVQRFVTGFGGRLWLAAGGGFGRVWLTDGTEEGTGPLLDPEGGEIEGPFDAVALGGRLFFTGGLFPETLWESDGTPAGTARVRGVSTNGPGRFSPLRAGSRILFGSYDPGSGHELWAVQP